MNLFISHADSDKELATKFVDLLRLGIGVPHENIFCSSSVGTIPNGSYFVQHILNELNRADLVIALLTRSYFASHFCLEEAGAALARQTAGFCEFVSFVVPPVEFSHLDGMLYGRQCGSILERPVLGELRDRVHGWMKLKPLRTSVWDEKREDFLKAATAVAAGYETKESLSQITVADYRYERDENPKTFYHTKLRIVLKNGTGRSFKIESGQWSPTEAGVCPTQSQDLKWQLTTEDAEALTTNVPLGSDFRTWIALANSVEQSELLKRSPAKRTGTMKLTLQIEGHVLNHALLF